VQQTVVGSHQVPHEAIVDTVVAEGTHPSGQLVEAAKICPLDDQLAAEKM
jgi:hypothetical protein